MPERLFVPVEVSLSPLSADAPQLVLSRDIRNSEHGISSLFEQISLDHEPAPNHSDLKNVRHGI